MTPIKAMVSELGPRDSPSRTLRAGRYKCELRVQLTGDDSIRVRTYERGVGETLACGTGVTAAGLITAKLHDCGSPIPRARARRRRLERGV